MTDAGTLGSIGEFSAAAVVTAVLLFIIFRYLEKRDDKLAAALDRMTAALVKLGETSASSQESIRAFGARLGSLEQKVGDGQKRE